MSKKREKNKYEDFKNDNFEELENLDNLTDEELELLNMEKELEEQKDKESVKANLDNYDEVIKDEEKKFKEEKKLLDRKKKEEERLKKAKLNELKKANKNISKKNTKKTKFSKKSKYSKTIFESEQDDNENEIIAKKYKGDSVGDELLKVTNIMSKEQINKPKKMVLTITLYFVVFISIIIFLLIKFAKPQKSSVYLDKKLSVGAYDDEVFNNDYIYDENDYSEKLKEKIIEEKEKQKEYEKIKEIERESIKETIEKEKAEYSSNINESKKEKSTIKSNNKDRLLDKLFDNKKSNKIEDIADESKEIVENKIIRDFTDNNQITREDASLSDKNTNTYSNNLPQINFKENIYSYATFYQYSKTKLDELLRNLTPLYDNVKNLIFGSDVDYTEKGTRGVIFLNYKYLSDFISEYSDEKKFNYENLPETDYFMYIMNDKFKFDSSTRTTNLQLSASFDKAKDKGLYFEVPGIFYEPYPDGIRSDEVKGKIKKDVILKILKKAKIGFSQNFALASALEIIDMECGTKVNPYYCIEEIIGENPFIEAKAKENGYDVKNMLNTSYFNYVVFDKKGYITDIFYFS